jgi:hypothetical protein
MFGKSQNESKSVHCEVTGNKTTIENTVALVKIDGVIALKNFNNPSVDFDRKEIQSMDKPPLKFYSELIVPEDLKPIFGRLFSIIDDEDEMEHSTAIMSAEGIKIFSGKQLSPLIEHIQNGTELLQIPPSMFFAVIDTVVLLKSKTCENWQISFDGLGKKYRFKNILEEKRETQTFGIPGILMPGYDLAVSDCSQKNPNGTGYMYKTDGSFKSVDLCSNESAVSFCKKNYAIVYYNDFLNNGKLRVLTSETENINKNLQNSYLFRSLNI